MARLKHFDSLDADPTEVYSRLPPRALHPSYHTLQRKNTIRRVRAVAIILAVLSLLTFLVITVSDGNRTGRFNPQISCGIMTTSGGLEIALSIQNTVLSGLSFGGAKAVDIAWNFVFGQLGRLLLAYLSYRIFDEALTKTMEVSGADYDLYIAVKLFPISLNSVKTYARALLRLKGFHRRSLTAFFLLSAVAVFLWPTLVSATFGYISPSKDVISVHNGTSFLDPKLVVTTACWLIPNGQLIGLSENANVDMPLEMTSRFAIKEDASLWDEGYPSFFPMWNDNNLTWTNSNLGHDSIPDYGLLYANITAYYHFQNVIRQPSLIPGLIPQPFWINDFQINATTPLKVLLRRCWNGTLLDWAAELGDSQNYHCLQEDGYVWGYAWIPLMSLLSILLFWSLATFIVWWSTNRNSEFKFRDWSRSGEYRAIIDLAEAMVDDLGGHSCSYSNSDIRKALSSLELRYYQEHFEDSPGLIHVGLSSHKRGKIQLEQKKLWGGLNLTTNQPCRNTRGDSKSNKECQA